MRFASPLLAATILTLVTGNASAQPAGAIEVSVLGVWHNKTITMDGLRGLGVGGRVGVWLPMNFEVEGQVDMTKPLQSATGGRFTLLHVAGSLLYNVPIGGGSAYLRGGFGKLKPSNCVVRTDPCPSHSALTGAVGFRVPIMSALQFRAEGMIRNRSAYRYTSFGASVGFSLLPTGRRTASDEAATVAAPRSSSGSGPDADGDGVANRRDRCPNTPKGALTDERGCPSDFDADGVADGIDRCPNTPKGTSVDPIGCPVKRPD